MLRGLLSETRFRLRALFAREAAERELDAEIQHHLAHETERLVGAGLSRQEAERQSRIAFGPVEDIKDSTRDVRGVGAIEHLARDVRYAFRSFAQNPTYAAAAVVSLALGIGANTAMFSAVDSLMLRPLPVSRPKELVTFEVDFNDGYRQYNIGYSDFLAIRALRGVVHDASVTSWAESFDVKSPNGDALAGGGPARISVVSGNYFQLLGIPAQRGRVFAADDDGDDAGGHPLVVISDGYWERAFGRDPAILGRSVRVNGTVLNVIGVAPSRFTGDWVGWQTDMWVPTSMIATMHPESETRPRGRYQYKILARLEPAVSVAGAQSAADVLYPRLIANPQDGSGISANARLVVRPAATGYSPQRDAFARPLAVLMAIVAVVLLIACANLANLQLARAVAREREIALRVALGADWGRVVRQLMTESLILALLGGACGLIVAEAGMRILQRLAVAGPRTGIATGSNPLTVDLALRLDSRALIFTLGLCLLATVIFGLTPAFRGFRPSLLPALGIGAARTTDGKQMVRSIFVVAQVALSVLLVVSTGLFVRTLRNLETESLGFDRSHLLLIWALPGHTRQSNENILRMWERLAARLGALNGVTSAAVSVDGLLSGRPTSGPVLTRVNGAASDTVRVSETMTVSPKFFATTGQTILAGRDFTPFDTDSVPDVIVINETLARRIFGNTGSVIGQQLRLAGSNTSFRIVGVVADARQQPRTPVGTAVYYPAGQNLRRLARGMCIVLRTNGASAAVANTVRRELRLSEPALPILSINDVDEQLDRILFRERFMAAIAVAFSVLAILLSCVGLYGVVSYVTSRRAREIGVRMALGASRSGVLAEVLAWTMRLTAAGIIVGLGMSLVANQTIAGLLFGVSPADTATMVISSAVFLGVAAVAGFLPAYRASRVSPMVALRSE